MNQRLLGSSGLRVAELCLGTMHLSREAGRIYGAYRERGGNFVDTANVYQSGASETLVGSLVHAERDAVVLCTKYTCSMREGDPNASGNGRKNLRHSLEHSLRRLRTDHVDLLWVHAWDNMTPLEELAQGLDEVVRSGKVRYVGLSDTPAWVAARAQTLALGQGGSPFVAMQLEYGLTHRTPEAELLPMAQALGLGVTAWGTMSGVLPQRQEPRQGAGLVQDRAAGASTQLAGEVAGLAAEIGCSAAQVALAWVRQQPGGILPILSPSRIEHMLDGLGCLELRLSEEQLHRLAAAGIHGN